MIVLDTTVLVYAKGTAHSLRDPCRTLLGAIADGEIEATTTAEVIREFVHVRARRRGREDAASLGRDYVELLSPLLPVEHEQLLAGLRLFKCNAELGVFDAVLAASAIQSGAGPVVSADRAFSQIRDLKHVMPDPEGVQTLLAG